MGEDWKFYDVADFNNWKRKQGSAYKIPPRPNFLAAALHIGNLLDGKKINWAAMGGLAMLCLGSRRAMPDIHLVYDDREFTRIKIKLEADRRIRLPKSMNPLFPSKILISTGPKFKDAGCSETVDVEVDLIPSGSYGTPSSDALRNHQVALRLNQDGKSFNIKGLNMRYIMNSTVFNCRTPDLVWDPRKDILFLCRNYEKEVGAIRNHLDIRAVQENFLSTGLFSRLPPEEQRICYNVLLGVDPPPSMSLTPAQPPSHRAQMPSHKSSPSLNTATQQPSNFLTPPQPGKQKPRQTSPTRPPHEQNSAAPKLQQQGIPASSTAERDSRTRYRTANGAPNIPSSYRDVSPETNTSQSKSLNTRGQQQHSGNPSQRAQPVGLQTVAHVAHVVRPQVVDGSSSSPTSGNSKIIRPQKSLPVMVMGHPGGAVPIFAHGQNSTPTMPKLPANTAPASTAGALLPAFGNSKPHKPKDSPQNHFPVTSNENVPRIPAASSNHSTAAQNTRTRHVPQPNINQGAPINHSLTGSSQAKGLRLVGPEGTHTPSQPRLPTEKPKAIAPPLSTNMRPTPLSNFVFELDASSPQATSAPQTSLPSTFIAELPAGADGSGLIVAELPAEADGSGLMKDQLHHLSHMVVSPPLPENQKHERSPVSPPHDYRPLVRAPQPQGQLLLEAIPPNTRTQSDPFDDLPSVLTIGGQGKRRSPSNSVSEAMSQPNSLGSPPVQKDYQRLRSSSYLTPESNKYTPNPNRVSMYKAYSAPTSPQRQPVTAPAQLRNPPPNMHLPAPQVSNPATHNQVSHVLAPMQHSAPTHFSAPTHNSTSTQVPAPMHRGPTHAQATPQHTAPIHPLFTQGPSPGHAPAPMHQVPIHGPTPGHAPVPMPKQMQQAPQQAPPAASKTGPAVNPLQIIPRHLLPNPLGANPPTPPLPRDISHPKPESHPKRPDSHQDHQEHIVNGAVSATKAVPYTQHRQHSSEEVRYNHSSNNNPRHHPQQFPQHTTNTPQQGQKYPTAEFRHGEFMPPNSTTTTQQHQHQRNISSDSQLSTASHDSAKLAQEYQMDLPEFGNGYRRSAYVTVGRELPRRDGDEETVYDFT